MWKFSIDIAERKGSALRRWLASADLFSEAAMARADRCLKTSCCDADTGGWPVRSVIRREWRRITTVGELLQFDASQARALK
jgi:hypothetical protein